LLGRETRLLTLSLMRESVLKPPRRRSGFRRRTHSVFTNYGHKRRIAGRMREGSLRDAFMSQKAA
jgi:hypothetical protein